VEVEVEFRAIIANGPTLIQCWLTKPLTPAHSLTHVSRLCVRLSGPLTATNCTTSRSLHWEKLPKKKKVQKIILSFTSKA